MAKKETKKERDFKNELIGIVGIIGIVVLAFILLHSLFSHHEKPVKGETPVPIEASPIGEPQNNHKGH